MKRSWARKLVADLKTNPPKCKGGLQRAEGYCCLGRLALLMGYTLDKVGTGSVPHLHKAGVIFREADGGTYASTLPREVRERAGLVGDEQSQLINANDDEATVDWKPVIEVLRQWT